MIDVYLTVDTEVWCNGWDDLDGAFPAAFESYVYGPTLRGRYGLPHQVGLLKDHGLRATFFVESLFADRFGIAPLAEIVGLLLQSGQDVQLHAHPEWALEAPHPVVAPYPHRRAAMAQFTLDDQQRLLARAAALLVQAGSGQVRAFRAGSFAFNRDTLRALHRLGIPIDASCNASLSPATPELEAGDLPTQPFSIEGVFEFPMTLFHDGLGRVRHLQLTACSISEMERVMWSAAEVGHRAVVVLWHNFELLNTAKDRPDPVVCRRLVWLLSFLDRHRDVFRVQVFDKANPPQPLPQPPLVASGMLPTMRRLAEQALRRSYG